MALIVDAYNVLHRSHVLPDRYAMVGGRGLCRLLDRSDVHGGRMVVVCDGDPKPDDDPSIDIGRVELIYSGQREDADTVIERLIAEDTAPRDLLVVSDDHRIRRAARRRRAKALGSDAFLRRLARALSRAERPAPSPEKPAAEPDPERWMREFGLEGPGAAGSHPADLNAQTERWMREFGFEPDDED